ncbi:Rid family detoxifying hydrolase [Buchnera aphidicola]|uniref:Yhar n=1 Tax=Buchnera aphidicola str. USDA (Myzus persicae) TaxID=1009856 RepID=W0P3J4_BUCMP|nr:Rid family detoxifying hydrolase [Buchnera aphidicola]AHG60017.1 Yhar [Buchnera aphidicola str. USDA (Myzus persicae)]AHG60597.1 Yhar [Buchnera aphidicola str. W106 (Myzus persicae)]AHG61169.1 Yhar [Buchnera aphidicola str. G002 (Myzus persicae)]AHG61742.1 Yhar [Buchnera aphidicola str. F009 (Myzus persicae)]WAI03298.1 MAG: Rid family detoxifying hydrolase [Buchnera aphidicola (Myzus persicae)]
MKDIINTKNAPQPIGPYSQAIQVNNILILSGQIPIDVVSNYIPQNISEQTYLVLVNIKAILTQAKFQIKDIIKTTIFTTDLKKIDIINEIYTKFFIDNKSEFPARSCVEVKSLPKNVKIEIEAIAYQK